MAGGIDRERSRWGIHSIITMGGEPFAVMQKWSLWSMDKSSYEGGCALATIPEGEVKVVPLRDCVSDRNRKQLAEEMLDE